MGNKQKGGAVFVSGTPKKCRAAKIRAALVGQLVFARLAIPRPDHIKAVVAVFFHPLFFCLALSGIFGGDLSVFLYFPDGYSNIVCFGRIIFHAGDIMLLHRFLLTIRYVYTSTLRTVPDFNSER